jgi:hypothetical protein
MDHAERTHRALEPLHAMINFVPELYDRLTGIGLRPGRMPAFASRVASMGAVTAGALAGVFYSFNPELIARHFPRAWTLATPQDVVAGRFDAVDASLRRILGPETVGSPELAEAADLAKDAAEGCEPNGRPLYAAHAELDCPREPHIELWHAVTLLREYRGDGHNALLVSRGIDGLAALVAHTATGSGFFEPAAKMLRGWSDEQWAEAVQRLQGEGILDAGGRLTDHGAVLRQELEDATNALAEKPWRKLGSDKANRLYEIGSAISKQIVASGAFPEGVFAGPAFTP